MNHVMDVIMICCLSKKEHAPIHPSNTEEWSNNRPSALTIHPIWPLVSKQRNGAFNLFCISIKLIIRIALFDGYRIRMAFCKCAIIFRRTTPYTPFWHQIHQFQTELDTFQSKLNALLSKLNTFEVKLNIFQIRTSIFHIKTDTFQEAIFYLRQIQYDILWNFFNSLAQISEQRAKILFARSNTDVIATIRKI